MKGTHGHVSYLYQGPGDRETKRPGFHNPFLGEAPKCPKILSGRPRFSKCLPCPTSAT